MRHPLKQLGLVAACLGMGCIPASAEQNSGLDAKLKLRTGLAITGPKDNLDARTIGVGLDFGYATSQGRLGFEFGYQYKSGKQYLTDLSTMEVAPGQAVTQWIGSKKMSVESKKNKLHGLAFRFSYEKNLSAPEWSVLGGLQLGGAKFRQEVVGDVCGIDETTSPSTTVWRDTYNGTPEKSTLAISPFVGFQYRFSESSSLEFNLIALSYTANDYRHVAGTVKDGLNTVKGHTSQDHFVESKRMLPHLEFVYVFRF